MRGMAPEFRRQGNLQLAVFALPDGNRRRGAGVGRKCHGHFGADVGFAGHFQFAAYELRHAARYGQAQTQSGIGALHGIIGLMQRLEHRSDHVLVETRTCIGDYDDQLSIHFSLPALNGLPTCFAEMEEPLFTGNHRLETPPPKARA